MGLIHLDGNKRNTSKDNLMDVSLPELKQFHKLHHEKLSSEYTRAIFLQIRLNQKIKEVENGQ